MCSSLSALKRQRGLLGRCSTPEWHVCARYGVCLLEKDRDQVCVFLCSYQKLSACSLRKHVFVWTGKLCMWWSVCVSAPAEVYVYIKSNDVWLDVPAGLYRYTFWSLCVGDCLCLSLLCLHCVFCSTMKQCKCLYCMPLYVDMYKHAWPCPCVCMNVFAYLCVHFCVFMCYTTFWKCLENQLKSVITC